MRISKTFNQSNQISVVIKALANDEGSVGAFGFHMSEYLDTARSYFEHYKNLSIDPNNKKYREFALPILDELARATDPTYKDYYKKNRDSSNPSSEYFDWIIKVYAERATQFEINTREPYNIKSEDLQKIHDELQCFKSVKNSLAENGKDTDLNNHSYDSFCDVIRPMMSNREVYRTIENAPDHILDKTSILYHGEEGAIVVPHTYEASKYFGSVHWCVSYDNTDTHFKHYNKKSPLLMYLPNPEKLDKDNEFLITGKMAVVDNKVYDEVDTIISMIFHYIKPLQEAAIANSSKGVVKYLELFGDITTIELSDDIKEIDLSYLDNLPEKRKSLLSHYAVGGHVFYDEVLEDYPYLSNDRIVVLSMVKQDGKNIYRASDSLRDDSEIVLAAIEQNIDAFEYVHDSLLENTEFVEGLLDVFEKTQDRDILKHFHQIPAFYGHMTTDVTELRNNLNEYIEQQAPKFNIGEDLVLA